MTISAVSGSDQRTQFTALVMAVESGNIAAAQDALKAYQSDPVATQSSDESVQDATIQDFIAPAIKTDLSTLTSAIASGSIADAQTALRSNRQSQQGE